MDVNLQAKLTAYALGEAPAQETATLEALLRVDPHAQAVLAEIQESLAGAAGDLDLAVPTPAGACSDAADDDILPLQPVEPLEKAHPAPLRLPDRCHLAIESELQLVQTGPRQPRLEAHRRRRIEPEPYAWLPAAAAAAVLIAFGLTLLGLPAPVAEPAASPSVASRTAAGPRTTVALRHDARLADAAAEEDDLSAVALADAHGPGRWILASTSDLPQWAQPINWPDQPTRVHYAQTFGQSWLGYAH